ncbi:MAG: type II secretion system major pseudopilin GspG [Verrucomicrobiota bacterium]
MKVMELKRVKASRGGFTLLEMMLVFGLIALLLGSGVYVMVNVLEGGKIDKVQTDLSAIDTALVAYHNRALFFPTTEQGLRAVVERPTSPPVPPRWIAGLKESALNDPWQRPYQYKNPPTNNTDKPDVWSMGPDGQPNTEDDLGNWN